MLALIFAAAITAQAPQQAAAAPATAEKPKMVCHREAQTGGIIAKKVCITPEQAAARAAQDRRDPRAQRDSMQSAGPDVKPN